MSTHQIPPSQKTYEFGRVTLKDKLPLLAAKGVALLFILFGCWLCLRPAPEANVLDGLATILTFSAVYATLATEKSDLRKLFIEPFDFYGKPLVLLAIGLSMYKLWLGFS